MGQTAALYVRVSTVDQSCQRPIADLTAFAQRWSYAILETFTETASGAAFRRPAHN